MTAALTATTIIARCGLSPETIRETKNPRTGKTNDEKRPKLARVDNENALAETSAVYSRIAVRPGGASIATTHPSIKTGSSEAQWQRQKQRKPRVGFPAHHFMVIPPSPPLPQMLTMLPCTRSEKCSLVPKRLPGHAVQFRGKVRLPRRTTEKCPISAWC